LDTLVGPATNEFEGVYHKADLPEIAGLRSVNAQTELTANNITTESGDVFTVIDASKAIPANNEALTLDGYGVITAKMLDRMAARNGSGKPQILTADNTMQKVIESYGSAKMFELRMGGKTRLYFIVQERPSEVVDARIIILGAHGDNEQAQHRFLRTVDVE
jgi:predicted patatin/cPLA2 family phospholipase